MKRARQKRFKPPIAGTCRICGCADDRACAVGCSWVDAECTLCSACAGSPADARYSMRWICHLLRSAGDKPPADNITVKAALIIAATTAARFQR